MGSHRRRLPHFYPDNVPLFLTFRLHGSFPASQLPPAGSLSSGQAFMWLDRRLDSGQYGPTWLARADIARIIVASILKGADQGHYGLAAWVVMPNHVHLLVTPRVSPAHLLKSLKGATARDANRLLGRTGEPFRQKESYDHSVRNRSEFERIQAYIETNPVKAGLVRDPVHYPWSSAGIETSLRTPEVMGESGACRGK
jgi:REP element-mobilizing transposase RayT